MEQTIEEDVFRLAPPGVGVHFSRIQMANEVTVETLEATASKLAGTAALLLPDGGLDVVVRADDAKYEDTFVFGPDLLDQVNRKVDIMRAHWRDVERWLEPPHK